MKGRPTCYTCWQKCLCCNEVRSWRQVEMESKKVMSQTCCMAEYQRERERVCVMVEFSCQMMLNCVADMCHVSQWCHISSARTSSVTVTPFTAPTLHCQSCLSLYKPRQHLSYDDCLQDKTGDYQNCSVLYCLNTIMCTEL